MPLDISRFFEIDVDTYADKGIVVYGFKDGLLDEFVSEFLLPFRDAYSAKQATPPMTGLLDAYPPVHRYRRSFSTAPLAP